MLRKMAETDVKLGLKRVLAKIEEASKRREPVIYISIHYQYCILNY